MVRHSFPLYLALHILLLEECQAHSSLPIAVTADQADFTDGVGFHDVQFRRQRSLQYDSVLENGRILMVLEDSQPGLGRLHVQL